ncbi:MAG: hypothetical protein RID22_05835 [Roseibium aggregatum]
MNRRVAFPFLTLSDSAVSATPWQLSLNDGDWIEAEDYLPDWDSTSIIRLRRTIRLEPELAAHDLSIPLDELQLALAIRIGTGSGRMPRMILERRRKLLKADAWKHNFDIEISGRHLSIVLDVHTEITLATPPSLRADLSPRTAGDRLWSNGFRLRLEGEEPRFPIETANLSVLFEGALAASSPWHLHWSPKDWNRDFHGAVRLYLNETADMFLERVESQDGPTIQVLLADVMGQICERFLMDPEAEEMMDSAEPGSLGAQAVIWLRKAWPGKDAAFIRATLENRPGNFRATMLALAEPGEA